MTNEMTVTNGEDKRKQLWGIWFAGVLILMGLIFGANNQGLLPEIIGPNKWDKVEWADWVLLGAGVWGLAINMFRSYSAEWPVPNLVEWLLSGGLTLVGVSQFFNLDVQTGDLVGAAAMMGFGVALLFITLRKKNPA
jgi:hypothetical protein